MTTHKYFKDSFATLIHGDAFEYLDTIADGTVDMVVTDPPYFLSHNGISNHAGKMVSVNKGDWDSAKASDAEAFYDRFIVAVDRILKPDGTLWIFGTMHNIYTIGYLLQKHHFKLLNNVTWQKSNPVPNLSCRMFTHSTETILWAKREKGKQQFNYHQMKALNGDRQMKDVWTTASVSKSEKRFGKHPTQKPLSVLMRILQSSSTAEMTVVDPFVGTGTTLVAAKRLGVKAIGVDSNSDYLEIARQRLVDFENEKIGKIK